MSTYNIGVHQCPTCGEFYFGLMQHECNIKKPKPSKWHKVEDGLPDNDRDVLVKTDVRMRLDIAWLDKEGSWHCPTTKAKITHWRDLPLPPKE